MCTIQFYASTSDLLVITTTKSTKFPRDPKGPHAIHPAALGSRTAESMASAMDDSPNGSGWISVTGLSVEAAWHFWRIPSGMDLHGQLVLNGALWWLMMVKVDDSINGLAVVTVIYLVVLLMLS